MNQKLKKTEVLEIELRIESKVRIDEVNRLKEEVSNNDNILSNSETQIDTLTYLKYEEKDIMNNIMTSEEKLRELRMPSLYIIGIKNLIL